jgi:lysozyme
MTVLGYDLSSVQGNLSVATFQTMASQGISFIIAKCYTGNNTNGVDPTYYSNITNAQAAGLQVAAYHFIYPLPNNGTANRDPVSQANLHFQAAGNILAFCDAEWPATQDWASWGCTAAQINQWVLTYLQTYSQLSGRPMPIYTYPYWAQSVGFSSQFSQYPLWIASYGGTTPTIPAPWSSYCAWQYGGGTGKLPNGAPVDQDLAPDLSLWGFPASTMPVGAPLPVPSPLPAPSPNPAPTPPSSPGNGGSDIWTSIGDTVSQLFSRCKK